MVYFPDTGMAAAAWFAATAWFAAALAFLALRSTVGAPCTRATSA